MPGAGQFLSNIKTSSSILNAALQYPYKQLKENIGMDESGYWKVPESVIDPIDVLIAGIESAVSIASILLTSSGMIVESPLPKN